MGIQAVIDKLKPTESERKDAEKAITELTTKLAKKLRTAKLKVGGSFAKKTWIRGMHDIDIFACFKYRKHSEKDKEIPNLLETALKGAGIQYRRIHGSRDYFEAKSGKYSLEIIPILDITSHKQAKNTTDSSMLHTDWVRKNTNQKLADNVRLLKAFCMAHKCYGAESHIRGLSGYACEILIANYESLENALKSIRNWGAKGKKTMVDVEGHYKNRNLYVEMNAAKIQSPVIIVDPVQRNRNAAAALSQETVQRLRESAKKYLKKPSEEFFNEQHATPESIKKKAAKGKTAIVIEAEPLEGKNDIVLSKICKAAEHIKQELEKNSFKIYSSGIEWQEKPLIWVITEREIPKEKTVKGPLEAQEKHAKRFRKKHKKTFAAKGRLYATIRRKHNLPETLVAETIKDSYVKERTRKTTLKKN
ncbi:CCA tRNA nucleotidyltransferase [Candidatus Woesearchaeota archaeon]|nr:CCA tRNA nucleotidyltransferase [Candidatus Woesearchaeota archaeon]